MPQPQPMMPQPLPLPLPQAKRPANAVAQVLSLPPRWLALYDDFISKNAGQVSQIESALRSLTYIIPGRFRDAEIASESIHSGVQLLSLYHDNLLTRAATWPSAATSPSSTSPALPPPAAARSVHARYTRFWAHRSPLYRRVALVLQMLVYTQLLQLRDRGLRTTPLERDEWNKRAWAMAWWAMRGAFYDKVTRGFVGGLTRRMPGFVAGILDDYEYLWENYYFSTSA
ncbi:peroxisomal membrane protein pex16 [Ophiocordyceps sinensis CO18]|uniref:Peroxisomal membrane protein PEX16 n=1 Tax=Ophiocordyceps sinensis (strain Co18 / CGMCC 3.14243) TaxID=911162 RepID=T5AFE1_OPHSC|nr:peroxisomal membrane protein pex16 [Ophiocordyceps sinensis CO18]